MFVILILLVFIAMRLSVTAWSVVFHVVMLVVTFKRLDESANPGGSRKRKKPGAGEILTPSSALAQHKSQLKGWPPAILDYAHCISYSLAWSKVGWVVSLITILFLKGAVCRW